MGTSGAARGWDVDKTMVSETLFCGCSLALILASETFLLARAATSAVSLVLLVGTQAVLCLVLGLVGRRTAFLDRVSPLWVCALFLVGVAWSLASPGLFGADPSSPLLVVPAAALFGLGNSLNGYHLLDYCNLTPPGRFARASLGGSGVAAVLNYVISYLLDDEASVLCGVLALAWYALSRRVSQSIAANPSPCDGPVAAGRKTLWVFAAALASLGFACGLLPAAVFSGAVHPVAGGAFGWGLAAGILAIACVLVACSACLRTVTMASFAPVVGLLTATGLIAFAFGPEGWARSLGASAALVFTLASACALFCLFVRLVGSAREHPGLFWGAQVAVLLCTFVGTYAGITLSGQAGSAGAAGAADGAVVAPCFAATYFILAYLVLFQRLWVEPPGAGRDRGVGGAGCGAWADTGKGYGAAGSGGADADVGVGGARGASGGAVAARCAELAVSCGLTRREREVLELTARGWTIDMVARQLVVSPDTARTHLKHLYSKLGVHSRTELLDAAGVGLEAGERHRPLP